MTRGSSDSTRDKQSKDTTANKRDVAKAVSWAKIVLIQAEIHRRLFVVAKS